MKVEHFWQMDTASFYSIVCSHCYWHALNLAAFLVLTIDKAGVFRRSRELEKDKLRPPVSRAF